MIYDTKSCSCKLLEITHEKACCEEGFLERLTVRQCPQSFVPRKQPSSGVTPGWPH
jgi:hypothetical protein